ncbi:MAG: PEGA domain-containing protein [Methanomicrobiales archaeon]|nr:PEGA domain-containing protein [Methanomicrobiales archaeon]
MKTWPRLIGVIIILALFCSPVLAISQSDLISQLRSQGAGTGTLSVTSSPVGAEVYLDGVYKGTTSGEQYFFYWDYFWDYQPVTITGIPLGLHNLRVTLSGYEDYSSWVIIPNDKTVHVRLKAQSGSTTIPTTVPTTIPTTVPTLTPTTVPTTVPTGQLPLFVKTGTVSVSSTPTGARVSLDGVDRGTTPVIITGVPTGLHLLKVTLSGYEDYSTRFFLVSGKTVSVTLERIPINHLDDAIIAKPNIYLYSDQDLTARVRLFPEEAITVSDPPYKPGIGWKAEIRNGSLNGAGDFLFYEGNGHVSGWQKEEGYVIRGAYREQDMASMLGEYGFNEKETDEFIEYWACHLAGDRDYVLYPQETDAVNRAMPLSVIPEPDAVNRIWFYAEPLVSAPEPVTNPEQIGREGFSIVEWGVIIRDEFWDT